MSASTDITSALRELESLLESAESSTVDPSLIAERVHQVLALLPDDSRWISAEEARRLLGVATEATVVAWARLDLLRSRALPDGGIELLLEDVLRQRLERDELLAAGGDEIAPEDLRVLREERPGTNPWQRDSTRRARAGR